MNHTKTIYFPHFDIIRFLAAFMVVILHSYEAWCGWFGKSEFLISCPSILGFIWGKYANQFFHNLGFGVDIFFLLSGFLITYILIQEKKNTNTIQIGKFILRRIFRIWPVYFGLIAVSPFIVSWVQSTPTPNYLAQLLFIGNFDTINTKQWIYPFVHFWSICVEEHFYIVWPILIAFIPFKRLLHVLIGLFICSIAFRIFCFYSIEFPWYTLYLHSVSRMDILVIGAIGAYFYSIKPFTFSLQKGLKIGLLIALIILLSIDSMLLWDTWFSAGFKKLVYICLASALLLDFCFNPHFKHRLPNKSIIHYLGKISYGIYMYSNILIPIIIKKIMWPFQISNAIVFFILSISITIFISVLSYEFFEKYFLKIGKRFSVIKTNR